MAIGAAAALLVLAPAARAADPPTGAVISSWHSPAGNPVTPSGTPTPPGTPESMPFDVTAHSAPDGLDLGEATLFLGPTQVSQIDLCASAGSCRDARSDAQLPFTTGAFADGTYDLRIVVADVDGNARTILDDPDFQIWNYRPSGSSTATLSVGSGVPAPAPGGGSGGGVRGASAGSCTSPKLSMVLDQRPLRIRHGVPVLVAGKRYRFTGRLTCIINGRRVSAPKRTRIDVRALVHGRSAPKGRTSVGARGRIVFRIASPSSCTLEFRFTAPNGKVTRVRIRIETVHVKKTKHKKG